MATNRPRDRNPFLQETDGDDIDDGRIIAALPMMPLSFLEIPAVQSQNQTEDDQENAPVSSRVENGVSEVTDLKEMIEIGHLATWIASTSRPGMGVEQLRDDNINTFWQSDGSQPHYLTLRFPREVPLCQFSIYIDFRYDESYSPARVSLFAGPTQSALEEVMSVDFLDPMGWFHFPLWID
ncbi:Anaphase-promoting complex subunit 10, partial [Gonapodya sp. JEL0774]